MSKVCLDEGQANLKPCFRRRVYIGRQNFSLFWSTSGCTRWETWIIAQKHLRELLTWCFKPGLQPPLSHYSDWWPFTNRTVIKIFIFWTTQQTWQQKYSMWNWFKPGHETDQTKLKVLSDLLGMLYFNNRMGKIWGYYSDQIFQV